MIASAPEIIGIRRAVADKAGHASAIDGSTGTYVL